MKILIQSTGMALVMVAFFTQATEFIPSGSFGGTVAKFDFYKK